MTVISLSQFSCIDWTMSSFNAHLPPLERKPSYHDKMKKSFSSNPDSLLNMAFYDLEAPVAPHTPTSFVPPQARISGFSQGLFHPVDEYKDMSVKDILDITDDFLFGEYREEEGLEDILNPVPLNVPVGQTVASFTGNQRIHTPVTSNVTSPLTPVSSVSASFVDSTMPKPLIRGSSYPATTSHLPHVVTPLNSLPDFEETLIEEVTSSAVPYFNPISCCTENSNSNKKRRREESADASAKEQGTKKTATDTQLEPRFRAYQAGQWTDRYNDLVAFKQACGHCCVPHTYKENLPLARWVKRQRYQYKLMMEGKSSTMTSERIQVLEGIGFIWDSQGAAWNERLLELKEFRRAHRHCNVPSNFQGNPQLATWVKCQRRQYKLHKEGKTSNMTSERIQSLEDIGFEWLLRSYKRSY